MGEALDDLTLQDFCQEDESSARKSCLKRDADRGVCYRMKKTGE